jgi:hypothetical protein
MALNLCFRRKYLPATSSLKMDTVRTSETSTYTYQAVRNLFHNLRDFDPIQPTYTYQTVRDYMLEDNKMSF